MVAALGFAGWLGLGLGQLGWLVCSRLHWVGLVLLGLGFSGRLWCGLGWLVLAVLWWLCALG
jgi:hypothetical protein